jgi:DnaJ-class molecular chaperone
MSREYWACIVDEVIPDAGVALTKEQRDEILENIIAYASMEGEATGRNIWDANLSASRQCEIDDAKKALRFEEEKIICRSCDGRGTITTYGGTMQCTSRCYECDGHGKVHPTKASRRTLSR